VNKGETRRKLEKMNGRLREANIISRRSENEEWGSKNQKKRSGKV